MSWLSRIDAFIPPSARAAERDPGDAEIERARLTVIACGVSGVVHAGTAVVMLGQELAPVALGNTLASGFSFGLPFAMRAGIPARWIGNALVAVLLGFVLGVAGPTGGEATSALHTAALLPGIAILLAGRRAGLVWVVLVCAIIGGLGLLRASGFVFPLVLDPARTTLARFPGVIALTLGTSGLILLYEWLKERSHAELAAARRATEAEAAKREALAERAQESQRLEGLGVLAGGVAHDFNNLLTVILGNASLIREAVDAEVAELADQVVLAAEQAGGLTEQLLAYAGRTSLARASLDLNATVRRVESLLRTAVAPDVSLRFDLCASAPRVNADPGQIQQIVMNLVTNAAEAMEGAGDVWIRTGIVPAEAPRATLGSSEPGARCSFLSVADEGVGFDAEVRARMFDPFYTTKAFGRGLGLSAVLGIVRAHGGAMRIDSEPGRGATLEVRLPCAARAEACVAVPSEPKALVPGVALVVDDEAPIRRFVARALTPVGLQVREAADGASALTLLRKDPSVCLVVLDYSMPGMRGDQVLAAIGRMRPDLPVILSSGFAHARVRSAAHHERVDWLAKPYQSDDLRKLARKLLREPSPATPPNGREAP